jgi:D-methionine transport system substrate-binding protein
MPAWVAPPRAPGRRHVLAALALAAWPCRDAAAAAIPLRIGALRGPQADLLRFAATLPPARRLNVTVAVAAPGAGAKADMARALSAGALDGIACANSQELEAFNAAHGTALVPGFPTVTLPFGIYSRRVRAISQLRTGDTIVLPAPPVEFNRARVLLYNYGLLFAHEDDGLNADFSNIVNPRGFVLQTASLSDLPARLAQAAAVVMPFDVAVSSGLKPSVSSIALEDGKSPYTQVLAVRAGDRGKPWLATLARAFQSRDMRRFIYQNYGDEVAPPW